MASSYKDIIDLPAGVCITSAQIEAIDVVGQNISPWTLSQETQVYEGQGWAMSLGLKTMTKAESRVVESFLLKLRGRAGRFRMGDPFCEEPGGEALVTGVAPFAIAGEAGTEELTTAGWTPEVECQLLEGDYVQVGDCLHRVTEDVNSDANGEAVLCLFPALRFSPGEGEVVNITTPRGVWRLRDNTRVFERRFTCDNGGSNSTGLDMIEAVCGAPASAAQCVRDIKLGMIEWASALPFCQEFTPAPFVDLETCYAEILAVLDEWADLIPSPFCFEVSTPTEEDLFDQLANLKEQLNGQDIVSAFCLPTI